ncbi:type II secretion system protein, partial [Halorubrum ezzemoulense]
MTEHRSTAADGTLRSAGDDDSAASEELRRAVAFLGWDVSAGRIVTVGYRVGAVAGAVVTAVAALRAGAVAAAPAGLAAFVGVVHAVHRAPVWLASLRRTRALGAAPGLVGRLVLRMRL